ncbi:DUF3592 domain-containing protein [Nocardioides montaniterrae]
MGRGSQWLPDDTPASSGRGRGLRDRWQVLAALAALCLLAAVGFVVAIVIGWSDEGSYDTSTTGTVTHRHVGRNSYCQVRAEFEVGGTRYTATDDPSCTGLVGDRVTIRYSSDDPSNATIGSTGDLIGYTVVFGCIAALCLAIAAGLAAMARSTRRGG